VPQFLSEEWINAAREIRLKYADQAPPFPHKITMNQVITDVPEGVSADGEVKVYMDSSSGQMELELGQLDEADVTISTDYDTARKIFVDQDPQAGMQAFMSGKIKITGDMTKLMMMQAAAPNDVAKTIAQEIKDITE
jgi:putative sterol carrier protein